MRQRQGHVYMGEVIEPCDWPAGAHRGAWFIQAYHGPTGMPYSDDLCAHYQTLADAKESVRESIAHAKVMA